MPRALSGAGNMIVGIDTEKRDVIRQMLARSFQESWTERDLVTRLKQVIGLTPKQAMAIQDQRRIMALNKVPEVKINAITQKRSNQLIRRRAAVIGRTERRRVINQGQVDLWNEQQIDGTLPPTAKWRSVAKKGCCPICRAKDGSIHDLTDTMAPPYHPECRCGAVLDHDPHGWDTQTVQKSDPILEEMISKAISPGGRVADASHFSTSTTSNWVARTGGLPTYILEVAHALIRSGHPEGEAIGLAVASMKKWAHGGGGVSPKVQAAAAAALAEFEAKAKASKVIPKGHEKKADDIQKMREALIEKRAFSTKQRATDAEKGIALPDGSFPIKDEGDLKNAITAVGRAKNPEAAKKHIATRAAALKLMNLVPTDWGSGPSGGDISKMRKVETPAGAKFFSKPIGTPITPALVAAAEAKHGMNEAEFAAKAGGASKPAGKMSRVETWANAIHAANTPEELTQVRAALRQDMIGNKIKKVDYDKFVAAITQKQGGTPKVDAAKLTPPKAVLDAKAAKAATPKIEPKGKTILDRAKKRIGTLNALKTPKMKTPKIEDTAEGRIKAKGIAEAPMGAWVRGGNGKEGEVVGHNALGFPRIKLADGTEAWVSQPKIVPKTKNPVPPGKPANWNDMGSSEKDLWEERHPTVTQPKDDKEAAHVALRQHQVDNVSGKMGMVALGNVLDHDLKTGSLHADTHASLKLKLDTKKLGQAADDAKVKRESEDTLKTNLSIVANSPANRLDAREAEMFNDLQDGRINDAQWKQISDAIAARKAHAAPRRTVAVKPQTAAKITSLPKNDAQKQLEDAVGRVNGAKSSDELEGILDDFHENPDQLDQIVAGKRGDWDDPRRIKDNARKRALNAAIAKKTTALLDKEKVERRAARAVAGKTEESPTEEVTGTFQDRIDAAKGPKDLDKIMDDLEAIPESQMSNEDFNKVADAVNLRQENIDVDAALAKGDQSVLLHGPGTNDSTHTARTPEKSGKAFFTRLTKQETEATTAGKFIQNGGSVEDALKLKNTYGLMEYLHMHPSEFKIRDSSGNSGYSYEVTDLRQTPPKKLFFKETTNDGQVGMNGDGVNEVMGSKFGRAAFPAMFPETDFAGTPNATASGQIQVQHLDDFADQNGLKNVEFDGTGVRAGNFDPKDALTAHIFDFLTNQKDRHSSNFGTAEDKDGVKHILPLDNGGSFLGFTEYAQRMAHNPAAAALFKKYEDNPEDMSYADWLKGVKGISRGSGNRNIVGDLASVGYSGDSDKLRSDASDIIDKFSKADPAQFEKEILAAHPNMPSYERAHIHKAVEVLQKRMAGLTPDQVVAGLR